LSSEENDIEEIRRPDFIASASVTYRPVEVLSLTTTLDHNGSQLDTDFGTFQNVTLDAFTLLGLNAAYDVNDTVTLSLRGDNLLDEDYQEVFGYASPGRAIYGGVKARL
jgi:vitamin B12 transporter